VFLVRGKRNKRADGAYDRLQGMEFISIWPNDLLRVLLLCPSPDYIVFGVYHLARSPGRCFCQRAGEIKEQTVGMSTVAVIRQLHLARLSELAIILSRIRPGTGPLFSETSSDLSFGGTGAIFLQYFITQLCNSITQFTLKFFGLCHRNVTLSHL
jgi:hypothetical protein